MTMTSVNPNALDAGFVSDLHKEAFRHRPASNWWKMWNEASPEKKQAIYDDLLTAVQVECEFEQMEEQQALRDLEHEIDVSIDAGAGDRATALRWIVQAATNGAGICCRDDLYCFLDSKGLSMYSQETNVQTLMTELKKLGYRW